MTVIRHNSISGIVSITAAAGSNLSFHDSTGGTLSLDTGDINAGVITATTANFTNATVTGDLTVQGTTTTLDTTVTEVDKLEVGANNTTVGVAITQSGTGDILRLYDSSTQVVTVSDGGRLLVGTTVEGEQTADDLTIATSGDTGMTIRSGDANKGNIFFSDATIGVGEYRGYIEYNHNGDELSLGTANATRLLIDSSGNIGIGTDNPATNFKLDVNGDLSLGEFNGTDNSFIDQKQNGSLEIINSGRSSNDGKIRINRFNNISGDTTYYRDVEIYDGKSNKIIEVDGSAALTRIHMGTDKVVQFQGNIGEIGSVTGFQATNTAGSANTDFGIRATTIRFATGSSERLRIDSSGNIAIGSAGLDALSARTSQAYQSLRIQNANITAGNSQYAYFGVNYYQHTDGLLKYIDAGYSGRIEMWGDFMSFNLSNGAAADDNISNSERMRISNGGAIYFAATSEPNSSVGGAAVIPLSNGALVRVSRTGTGYQGVMDFFNSNGGVGSITTSGSATQFNTSSDYRLKENITAVTDGIFRVQQLKPYRFNFIADPNNTVDGFIAHEVQDIVPEAIGGTKDEVDDEGNPVYQGIDQSKLVPLLTAALQEAIAKIESLEARLDAAGL
jgi:hypothetical protein